MEHDDDEASSEYARAFCAHTKRLRKGHGLTGPRAAQLLGIEYEAYKKNENRSVLPHRLMRRFCAMVGVTETQFYAGVEAEIKKKPLRKAG